MSSRMRSPAFRKTQDGEFIGGEEAWLPYLYTSIRRLAIDLCPAATTAANAARKTSREDIEADQRERSTRGSSRFLRR